jgi:uncharacterized protein with HEPN domain
MIYDDVEFFGKTYENFCSRTTFANSVNYCLLHIGENVKNLSNEFKESNNYIVPWKEIIHLRNLTAHDYGIIESSRIWETIINDIPQLKAFCEKKLNELQLDQDFKLIDKIKPIYKQDKQLDLEEPQEPKRPKRR